MLQQKITELRKRVKTLEIDTSRINNSISSQLRKAIRENVGDLVLKQTEIPLDKDDTKNIWAKIETYLPLYALFQSDRKIEDGDSEVQDPLKAAIKEAIVSVQSKLDEIKSEVQKQALEVANRTVQKLAEMDKELADSMKPEFKIEPKWESIFKITLNSSDGIPINKRGSGVRRLILFNFFRTEAERKQSKSNYPSVIYGIEEPETSQHPSNQKLLVRTLVDLSETENTQILFTTHVPGLAGLIPIESLKYVKRTDLNSRGVESFNPNNDDFLKDIADDLGVIPDTRIQVLFCVEGPNDVSFFQNISQILNQSDASIPDIKNNPKIAMIHVGGSTLEQWVNRHYLKEWNRPEVHIYDRDEENPPKYQAACDEVNGRSDGSWADLTTKREIENYIHHITVNEVFGIDIEINDSDDVTKLVKNALTSSGRGMRDGRIKKKLNFNSANKMTVPLLKISDKNDEIIKWLKRIGDMLT